MNSENNFPTRCQIVHTYHHHILQNDWERNSKCSRCLVTHVLPLAWLVSASWVVMTDTATRGSGEGEIYTMCRTRSTGATPCTCLLINKCWKSQIMTTEFERTGNCKNVLVTYINWIPAQICLKITKVNVFFRHLKI